MFEEGEDEQQDIDEMNENNDNNEYMENDEGNEEININLQNEDGES